MILGSDTQGENGNGKYTYDVELKGIEGSGKQYKTSELIEQRKKDILNILGASFLMVGQDGMGSYSLSDAKNSYHAFVMERFLLYIKSVFEREFIKSLADINEITLEQDEMPVMVFGELDDADAESASKMIQRVASVGLLPLHKNILIQAWQQCGFDTTAIEQEDEETILARLTAVTSRSGDGMEEGMPSGTGKANGNNSALNMDNGI